MSTITLPIYNTEGKEINTMKLDSAIFGDTINEACLYQVVNAYRANQRQGLAQTKTRGEVSGGGRKPWKQKGTGRARVGSIRSPLWRHGGVVFGPHPRDFSFTLPKKIKALALKAALYAKIKENNFIILDGIKMESSKTKVAAKVLSSLKIGPRVSALLLLDKIDNNLRCSFRNIGFLTLNRSLDTNTYEILAHQKLIITETAIKELVERLKKK